MRKRSVYVYVYGQDRRSLHAHRKPNAQWIFFTISKHRSFPWMTSLPELSIIIEHIVYRFKPTNGKVQARGENGPTRVPT